MENSPPNAESGRDKQKESAHSRSNLSKVTKSTTKKKKLGKGILAVIQQRKTSKASRDTVRAKEGRSNANDSSQKTSGLIQEHLPISDADFREVMGHIYSDLHGESQNPNILADHFSDVQRWAPELVVECLAKFGVVEAAIAHMSAPNDPLSSEIMALVASEFIGLGNCVKAEQLSSFKELTCNRYGEFAACESLVLLSILSHSATFRKAAETWDSKSWSILVAWIRRNVVSIAVFAMLRRLDYETSLKRVADHIPVHQPLNFLPLGDPNQIICPGPPDLWVISETNGIKPPTFQGEPQTHTDHNIYQEQYLLDNERPPHWPSNTPYPSDPTLRRPGQSKCACCKSPTICPCDPNSHPAIASTLLELHNYGTYKGTGIRALQPIHPGALLGEYVGEVRHASCSDDPVYGFDFTALEGKPHEVIATLSARRWGNWTRFVNHSCRSNCRFEQRAVGARICVVVVAVREIAWGEELTVNYGDLYWTRSVRCRCGEDCCSSRVWERMKREQEQVVEGSAERAGQLLEGLGDSLGFGRGDGRGADGGQDRVL